MGTKSVRWEVEVKGVVVIPVTVLVGVPARASMVYTAAATGVRDAKTVEHHIDNIYSKLHSDREEGSDDSRHPRLQAALTYLRATGLLPADEFIDE